MTPQHIIHFWADEVGDKRWFDPNPQLDSEIAQRFGETYALARDGKLSDWENTVDGALALLILLDQFPRNMFRGRAEAFATDAQARAIADRAIARGFDLQITQNLRPFFYLPLSHSEHIEDQERCVRLVAEHLGKDGVNYSFALAHRDVIAKFGRFPGRNVALGRQSTAEELQFLDNHPPF
ncbi:MAG TPA: DUF924 family protein [Rhizomicrobium sp.]|jgi:uncharacterized protein (DUF924 family)|nr:DUF924 family protein [Rhizomicrobium sp.]